MDDLLSIGGLELRSRFFIGTGKFSNPQVMAAAIRASGAQVVTLALRRLDLAGGGTSILDFIPPDSVLMPNTSGARDAEEAVQIARLARAAAVATGSRSRSSPSRST